MKIRKVPVKAAEAALLVEEPVSEIVTADPVCKYAEPIASIQLAMDQLASQYGEDMLAKESIANLAVVLMDLKAGC